MELETTFDRHDLFLLHLYTFVPCIEYESFHEFVNLVYEIRALFLQLIEKSINIQLSLRSSMLERHHIEYSRSNDHNTYWGDIYFPLLLPTALQEIETNGQQILLKLTKGVGMDWCEIISRSIRCQLLKSVQIFINTHYEIKATWKEDEKLSFDKNLSNFESKLIYHVKTEFHDIVGGHLPLSLNTFSIGFVGTLMRRNFCLFKNSTLILSLKQFDETLLLLHLAFQDTKTTSSPFQLLDLDTFQKVICIFINESCVTIQNYHNLEQWLF